MAKWRDGTAIDANMLKNAMDSEFLVSVTIIKVIKIQMFKFYDLKIIKFTI
jgi:hypothetical protein